MLWNVIFKTEEKEWTESSEREPAFNHGCILLIQNGRMKIFKNFDSAEVVSDDRTVNNKKPDDKRGEGYSL